MDVLRQISLIYHVQYINNNPCVSSTICRDRYDHRMKIDHEAIIRKNLLAFFPDLL